MIRLLRLQNFKCFENQSLPLKPLTLLTGLNSTGKSSVLQSLLLLRQSYQQGLQQTGGLVLNGDWTHIGTATDALFEGAKENVIGFDLVLKDDLGHEKKEEWRFNYDPEADVLSLNGWWAISEIYESSLFNDNFHYFQAERIGPRRFYEVSDTRVRKHRQLGSRGEYTAHFLSVFGDDKIPNPSLSHEDANSLGLKHQVEAWLGEVSPGTRISLTQNPGMDIVSLQYSFAVGTQVSKNYRATNVGFGITYTLPIIVAVLSSSPGALLLIENPEAHLHPKGQAKMGDLLARAASCGIQVLVETHSDHILNGVRLAVHDGKLSAEDVELHFFQRRKQDGQSQVVSPRMNSDGRIYPWPDGFFDEWTKSLEALLEPSGE